MKRRMFYGILLGIIFGLGCDDITSPPENPRAEKPPLEEEAKEIIKYRVSPEGMIETYNMIVELRNGLFRWHQKLQTAKQNNDPLYLGYRNRFRKWAGEKIGLIQVREEWYSPKVHNFPEDHPAIPLWFAIRTIRQMTQNFIYHYQINRPLKLKLDDELEKWMDDFKEKFDNWKFPEPSPAPINLEK